MIVCRTRSRPAPLLLKNPEITDDMIHPVPGTVLKIPGAPDHCTVITDNQAKLFSVVILDKDVPVLCGNGFGMFAGKVMPRAGRGGYHIQPDQNGISSENP